MEPPKTLKSHLSWLSGHWQQQEINKTNWEGRKRKCDWLRWGFRLSGCTQFITSPGSPNTLSSSPHDMPLILSFCLPLYLSSAWLLLSLPPLFVFFSLPSLPRTFIQSQTLKQTIIFFFAFVRWFHQHLTSLKEHCNVNQVSYQVITGDFGFSWIKIRANFILKEAKSTYFRLRDGLLFHFRTHFYFNLQTLPIFPSSSVLFPWC